MFKFKIAGKITYLKPNTYFTVDSEDHITVYKIYNVGKNDKGRFWDCAWVDKDRIRTTDMRADFDANIRSKHYRIVDQSLASAMLQNY